MPSHRFAARKPFYLGLAMFVAAALALLLTPHQVAVKDAPKLEQTLPLEFGDWKQVPNTLLQIGVQTRTAEDGENADVLYDEIINRTYVNSQGEQVMLALAYGKHQRQEYKVHRPEVCYSAQGFEIISHSAADFGFSAPSGARVTGQQLMARSNERLEAVSYWIRIGDIYSVNAWQSRLYIFREGLKGRIQDGILVRSSQIVRRPEDAGSSYETQRKFLLALVQKMTPDSKKILVQ